MNNNQFNNNQFNNNQFINNQELEINKKNREDYEKLMKDSSTNLDGYYDKNNIFVKILLLVLAVIIGIGAFIVITSFLATR